MSAGDLSLHRVAARHGDVDLPRANADRVAHGRAAKIGDAGALADQRDFLRRFHHAESHGVRGDVDEFHPRQDGGERGLGGAGQVVALDPDAPRAAAKRRDRALVIVPTPVGVDEVVAMAPPPRLPAVDHRGNGGGVRLIHDQRIGPPEGTIEKAGMVMDAVH